VIGQLHVSAATYTWKELPVSIGWETGWGPQPDVEAVAGRSIVAPVTRIKFFIFTCKVNNGNSSYRVSIIRQIKIEGNDTKMWDEYIHT
jgi:hypothetical protein